MSTTKEPVCPICLCPPVAPKMTKCGEKTANLKPFNHLHIE